MASHPDDIPFLQRSSSRLLLCGGAWILAAFAVCAGPLARISGSVPAAASISFHAGAKPAVPSAEPEPSGSLTRAEAAFARSEDAVMDILRPRLADAARRGMPGAKFQCRRERTASGAPSYPCVVEGGGAPLRFAQALRAGLAACAASLPFSAESAPRLVWTEAGILEMRAADARLMEFRFPGRERSLSDLSRPLPKPALIIVIDDMGRRMDAARALAALSFPVTFAVWPHAPHRDATARLAEEMGLDVLLHMPMEPLPAKRGRGPDPGRNALRVGMGEEKIAALLRRGLATLPAAVGFNNHMGSLFTADAAGCRAAARAVAGSGLLVLDSLTNPRSALHVQALRQGLQSCSRAVFLDNERVEAEIVRNLDRAAAEAKKRGVAVAIGHPYPETVAALRHWRNQAGVAVASLRRLAWKLSGDALAPPTTSKEKTK